MNLVDSSGWLEYFAGTQAAVHFAEAIENTAKLIVPTLSVLEVFRRILQQRGEADALQAAALMQQGRVIDLTIGISLEAARLGLEKKLPLADSVMLATARHFNAVLWTQDADFKGLEGVRYFPKHYS